MRSNSGSYWEFAMAFFGNFNLLRRSGVCFISNGGGVAMLSSMAARVEPNSSHGREVEFYEELCVICTNTLCSLLCFALLLDDENEEYFDKQKMLVKFINTCAFCINQM